ncbi:MAG: N-6 DNA methylase [Eubacteriales bacterium]
MRKFARIPAKQGSVLYAGRSLSDYAKVIGRDKATDPSMTVYDPACGSGSLRFVRRMRPPAKSPFMARKDNSTAGLARMNPSCTIRSWRHCRQ